MLSDFLRNLHSFMHTFLSVSKFLHVFCTSFEKFRRLYSIRFTQFLSFMWCLCQVVSRANKNLKQSFSGAGKISKILFGNEWLRIMCHRSICFRPFRHLIVLIAKTWLKWRLAPEMNKCQVSAERYFNLWNSFKLRWSDFTAGT